MFEPILGKVRTTYAEFPRSFWVLAGSHFVDRVGGTMLYPFFALYITQRFDVGMTEAGILFAIFSISGFAGSLVGGALADKLGRRSLVVFGLVASALSSLAMGFVDELRLFYALAVVAGLLSDVAGPASQAMVADLLPEEKRSEGFGVLRVANNLAWIIGPTIGGLLAARSYMLLFVLDAITSLITAAIVLKYIPETRPEPSEEQEQQSLLTTLAGYGAVLRDKMFMGFIFVSMLMLIPYLQIYSTLSVYLRDVHGVQARGFGLLLTINAAFVVIFQFWITRKIKPFAPLLMMAAGTLLYMAGLTMYGFVTLYALFVAAMVLVTFGEMIVLPSGQAMSANFAPVDMRGRYMAIFGLTWTIAGSIGPWGAGVIMDNYNPNWIWYLSGIISAAAATGFYLLYLATRDRFAETEAASEAEQPVP